MTEFLFNESPKNMPECIGIYAIKGIYNNFHLVGQTCQKMKTRWRQHKSELTKNKHQNPYLQNAFNKHGSNQFVFILLETCEKNKLNEREIYWIARLNSMRGHTGWNLREGGAYGKYSPELRKKVSDGIRNSPKALASRLARAKTYTLICPNGNLTCITNGRKFCRDIGVSPAALWKLMVGKISHCKGWKIPHKNISQGSVPT
jgi:hypothetical protein